MKRKIWALAIASVAVVTAIAASFGFIALADTSTPENATGDNAATAENVSTAENIPTFEMPKLEPGQSPEGMEKVAENDKFILHYNFKNGYLMLEDKRNGGRYYSNPPVEDPQAKGAVKNMMASQIAVTTVVVANDTRKDRYSNIFSVNKNAFKAEKIENGVKAIYAAPENGFEVPVTFTLDEFGLVAKVVTSEIKEGLPTKAASTSTGENVDEDSIEKIFNITILPFMGSVPGKGEGYILVPDGSGSLIYFNKPVRNYTAYRVKAAGEDPVFSKDFYKNFHELAAMPVVGIFDGKYGMLAVAEGGAGDAYINAAFAGLGCAINRAYFDFNTRSSDKFTIGDRGDGWNSREVVVYERGKIKTPEISVRYMPVEPTESGYSGMAATYRDYLIKKKGLAAKVPDEAPLFLELRGAVRVPRSILGVPVTVTEKYTTFQQAADIVKELNSADVGKIILNMKGWSEDEIRKKLNAKLDPVAALGGKNGLKTLADTIKQGNDQLYLNSESLYYYNGGNGVSMTNDASRNINAVVAKLMYYRRNIFLYDANKPTYRILRPTLVSKILNSSVNSIIGFDKSIGIGAGSLTRTLYTDFGNENDPGTSRDQSREILENLIAETSKKISILGDYTLGCYLPYVDAVVNAPLFSSNFDISDDAVPFYEMVLHGYIPYGSKPLNLYGNHTEAFLKAIETGAYINYSLMAGDPSMVKDTEYNELYSADYDYWKPIMLAEQKRIAELHAKVGKSTIEDHYVAEPGVVVTVYDNNVATVVNYNKTDITIAGKTVKATDFIIVEGGLQK